MASREIYLPEINIRLGETSRTVEEGQALAKVVSEAALQAMDYAARAAASEVVAHLLRAEGVGADVANNVSQDVHARLGDLTLMHIKDLAEVAGLLVAEVLAEYTASPLAEYEHPAD